MMLSSPRRLAGRRAAAVMSWGTCCLLVSAETAAQQVVCDSLVLSLAGGGQPYGNRGDRCEGTYSQPAGAGLYLQSIYQHFGEFDLKRSRAPLEVAWSAPPGRRVHLRADGRVGGESFRMDAAFSGDQPSFTWQTIVLRSLSSGSREPLSREHLAVRGWVDLPDIRMEMFVPLRIWQGDKPAVCGPVKFVLWAMSRPDSVYVEVSAIDPGKPESVRSRGIRELGQRVYPLNGALTFAVPDVDAAGIYNVKVSAKLGTERWSRQYLVYVAPDARLVCP